jgi:hypothetical protein
MASAVASARVRASARSSPPYERPGAVVMSVNAPTARPRAMSGTRMREVVSFARPVCTISSTSGSGLGSGSGVEAANSPRATVSRIGDPSSSITSTMHQSQMSRTASSATLLIVISYSEDEARKEAARAMKSSFRCLLSASLLAAPSAARSRSRSSETRRRSPPSARYP